MERYLEVEKRMNKAR